MYMSRSITVRALLMCWYRIKRKSWWRGLFFVVRGSIVSLIFSSPFLFSCFLFFFHSLVFSPCFIFTGILFSYTSEPFSLQISPMWRIPVSHWRYFVNKYVLLLIYVCFSYWTLNTLTSSRTSYTSNQVKCSSSIWEKSRKPDSTKSNKWRK